MEYALLDNDIETLEKSLNISLKYWSIKHMCYK